jgi:putative copper export protein
LFALLFGSRLSLVGEPRLRRWALAAVTLAVTSGIGSLAAQVMELTGGETLFDVETWMVVLGSRAGSSLGVGALGLLLVARLGSGRARRTLAALGGIIVCASYVLLGHTTTVAPPGLLGSLLFLHLLVAAFWIGSLPPLAWAAGSSGPETARLVEDWARVAAVAVPSMLVAGLLLAWTLVGNAADLVSSPYGLALLAKVTFVALLLGMAAYHRFSLTPALAAGRAGAGKRLATSIHAEAVVVFCVLWAAAELVSATPRLMHGAG